MMTARYQSSLKWAALLSTAALVLAGCGGGGKSTKTSTSPRPHTLVFDLTGTGELSWVKYVVDSKKTTEKSVELPWKKTIHLPAKDGGHTWNLKAHGPGNIRVYVDGRVVVNSDCEGDGCDTTGSANGSIRN